MDPSGSNTGEVVSTGGHVADSVSWNPTSGLIAFADTRRGNGRGRVYISGLDGSAPRLIARGAEPAWSPDGSEIAFRRGCALLVRTVGTFPTTAKITDLGSPRIVALDPWHVDPRNCHSDNLQAPTGQPEWSPDGRLIAVALPRFGLLVVRLNPRGGTSVDGFHAKQRVLAPYEQGRTQVYGFSKPAWQPVPVSQP